MRAVPRLCGFYPGIYLTTEERTSVRVVIHKHTMTDMNMQYLYIYILIFVKEVSSVYHSAFNQSCEVVNVKRCNSGFGSANIRM